jgi:MFS transporter, PHS family, inorganic phosphate transporter
MLFQLSVFWLSGASSYVVILFSLLLSPHPQLGVGVGGDYPLSAVISSEFASTKIRGRMMTAVFAAQGWGNFGTYHFSPNYHF